MDARLKDMIKSNPQTSNFISSQNNTPKLATYNSRYPWFDEEDYKRLVQIADAQWVTWSKKAQFMDELYQYYYPQVLNSHKLDERQEQINNAVYENWDALVNWEPQANINLKLTQLSQKAKEKFWIAYDTPDEDVIAAMRDNIPDGDRLLQEYVNDWNPELLYQAWIYDRPVQQWGTKDLINQASTSDKSWGEKNLWEKWETVTNYTNLVWLWTEELDEQAWKFADKWLDWGNSLAEMGTDSLKKKIENMSPEEIASYREQYNQLAKDKSIQAAYVEWDTLVEQLWNGIKWNIKYRDDDEAFLKWLVGKKANLGESLVWADDILKWETDPNVIQFFGNIPASTLKTFTATVRGMTNPYDTMKWIYLLGKDVVDNGFKNSAIWQRYWSWDWLAKAMNEDPVWVADDALAVAEIVWKPFGANIWSANDALAQKTVWSVYGVMDNATKLANDTFWDNIATKWLEKASNVLQTESSLSKMANELKDTKDYLGDKISESKLGTAIKNAKEEFINKIVGIDEQDREFIRNNKELVNDYLDGKKNVETVFEDVKEKINNKTLENSEMWKEYEVIRQRGQTVNTEALWSDIVDTFKKNKISINADWDLEFDKLSKFNSTQQKALQDAWQVIKEAQAAWNIDAWTLLDLRQKMDDKINWEGKAQTQSAVDKSAEKLIKEMRWIVDERAKTQIDWLKELDEKYWPAMEELNQIKKDWMNKDGSFKDNARSKIKNLTKAWNEERLSRLEKVAPWLTQDLKALDVWLTIERASRQGVWQYSKWFLWWSLPAGVANPIAWLAWLWLWILTTPKNYVKLVENYPDIVAKLEAGNPLTKVEAGRLQALASRIQDGMK